MSVCVCARVCACVEREGACKAPRPNLERRFSTCGALRVFGFLELFLQALEDIKHLHLVPQSVGTHALECNLHAPHKSRRRERGGKRQRKRSKREGGRPGDLRASTAAWFWDQVCKSACVIARVQRFPESDAGHRKNSKPKTQKPKSESRSPKF